jgi:hypothetical protein
MSRRKRYIAWLSGIIVLLALAYAGSPWIAAHIVKRELSAWDLQDIQVRAGYPGLHALRLHRIQFTTTVGGQKIAFQLNGVEISYRLGEILSGRLERIRVPGATAHVVPVSGTEQVAPVSGELASGARNLAAILSGQWLAQFPVREVALEQLVVDGRAPSDVRYGARLHGSIRQGQANASGIIELPARSTSIVVAFSARKNGETKLSLAPGTAEPILQWTIDPVALDERPVRVAGALRVRLHGLLSVLQPWFAGTDWPSQVDGDLNAKWQVVLPAASGKPIDLSVHVAGAEGSYRKIALAGVDADVALAVDGGVRTSTDAQLKVGLLDVGIPIRNLELRCALLLRAEARSPVVRVKKASAELLGGRARSEPFDLDFARPKNRFVVKLEGLSLHDIMELERQEGLEGTGILDGQLPVAISGAGIRVEQGRLSARAPGGQIRYRPTEKVGAMAKSNPSLKLVVDALSNFQYQKLEATANYQPDGNLGVQVRLEGKNPGWQSGRPVHLNLNVEENIPALLRSLQMGGEITERVREYYQKTR